MLETQTATPAVTPEAAPPDAVGLLARLKYFINPIDGRYEDLKKGNIAANVLRDFTAGLIVAMVAIARPLLFASIDEAVAEAAGVRVRVLGVMFLGLVGVTAAETTQAIGALLLLGLLAAPAAAAVLFTKTPVAGLLLSVALAVGAVWIGLGLSYAIPKTPPSFGIVAVATLEYALAAVYRGRVAARLDHPRHAEPATETAHVGA